MRGFGIDRILAGTAIALVLAAADGPAFAASEPTAAVEASGISASAGALAPSSSEPAAQPAAKDDPAQPAPAANSDSAPQPDQTPAPASAATEPPKVTPATDQSTEKPATASGSQPAETPADTAATASPAPAAPSSEEPATTASTTAEAPAKTPEQPTVATETAKSSPDTDKTGTDQSGADKAGTVTPETAKVAPADQSTEAPAETAKTAPADQPAAAPSEETAKAPPAEQPTAAPAETAKVTPPEQPAVKTDSAPDAAPKADTASTPESTPPAKEDDGKPAVAKLDTADGPIAEKLREIVTGKLSRTFRDKDERQAVEAFYTARGFAPLWIANGVQSIRLKALTARLKASDADGLDPADYKLPDVAGTDPEALADAELKTTATLLKFARHLQAGRVEISRISTNILMPQTPPDPAKVLTAVADAADTDKALDTFSPPQAGYKALKAKLAELRKQNAATELVRIPGGPILRPGMNDPRVALLRQRLDIDGDKTSTLYDDAVMAAVKKFQRQAGLGTDGMAGPNTLRAMNGPRKADQIETVIVNMERWRWLPRDLGRSHVMLNIPDFTLKVVRNGDVIWRTKVVVGKPGTPTPILTETMKFITVNPTWNVPPSIVYNEYLPALQQDPTVLERMGLKVVNNRDGTVHIYQPPGDRNALGRIRFNFPNKFLVYQHDTPDKHLFKHDRRAYSHGCMRVEDPLKYGEVLLSIAIPEKNYTAAGLRRLYGSNEHNINFPKPIPVHVTYQTAFVNEGGDLVIRPDIYGYDQRVMAGIKNDGRIDYASAERRRQAADKQRQRQMRESAARSYQPSGLSFFERLFQ